MSSGSAMQATPMLIVTLPSTCASRTINFASSTAFLSRSATLHGDVQLQVRHDHGELLASVAAAAVDGCCTGSRSADDPGQFPEYGITGLMAVVVVELLEVVDIEHHERERLQVPAPPVDFLQPASPGTCGDCRGRSGRHAGRSSGSFRRDGTSRCRRRAGATEWP